MCYSNAVGSGRGDLDMCSGLLSSRITKSECCCTIGRGWGDPCETCPEKNTTEYFQLCPDGSVIHIPDVDIELNKDVDGDGEPDVNIDTDGDGRPDVNIDT